MNAADNDDLLELITLHVAEDEVALTFYVIDQHLVRHDFPDEELALAYLDQIGRDGAMLAEAPVTAC